MRVEGRLRIIRDSSRGGLAEPGELLEAGPKTRVCEGEGGSRGLYRWSP